MSGIILDYTGTDYIVHLPRGSDITPAEMMLKRGLDFSNPDSNTQNAVLFTKDISAVADLSEFATPRALVAITPMAARIKLSRASTSTSHFKMPDDRELWPFQKASLDYALSCTGGRLIADSPGLGKTPQAIVFANEISAKRVLVVCPASIRLQWQRRIREWSTMVDPLIYLVNSGRNGVHPQAQWVVLSYAMARNPGIVAAIAAIHFDLLVIDESHMLKDVNSQQTRAIYGQADGKYHPRKGQALAPLLASAEHVLCLSGTPIVNRPLEAYTTARALAWDAIDYASYDKFRQKYNPQKETMLRGGKRIKEERTGRVTDLGNRMRGTFMARHAKRDVMDQLQMPEYDIVRMEETRAVKQALEAEGLLDIDVADFQTTENYQSFGHIAAARKLMGAAIAPQAGDYIKTLLDGGEQKIVVFGWHIEVLDILESALAGYGVLRIDGRTSGAARQHYVDLFQSDENMRVMLGNIQSMGTGVDGLQNVCTHCVIVEPSWTPGENQQAVDRLDRGGQSGKVLADFLVAPGSLSERILVAALGKAKTIHQTIG